MQFVLASGGSELEMRVNELCLDVANASNASNAHVSQFTCRGTGNQQWVLSTTP